MDNTLQPYPDYQDSEQDWLGKVPAHWDVLPNRALFDEIKDQGYVDEPLLSVTISRGIIPQEVLLEDSSQKDSSNLDKSKYKLVQPGDIAYNKMRAWQGAIGVSEHRGIVSPAYIVLRPKQEVKPRFYHYLLRTPNFITEAERWSYGITSDMWSLRHKDFRRIYSPIPPLSEQRRIAHFLDTYTDRTDRLIRAKERLIELLEEQKQAIIQRVVTRGLDPDVEMKDSGVDWLGEVPAHWDLTRVSNVANTIQTGPFGSQLPASDYQDDGDFPVINPSHIQGGKLQPDGDVAVSKKTAERISSHKLIKGDVILARRGELGRCAVVGENEKGWICGTGSIRIGCKTSLLLPNFLARFIRAPSTRSALRLDSVGATMANLSESTISNLEIAFPSVKEQNRIVNYLDDHIDQINDSIDNANQEITLIREYRTRLIADVVTGKLDVREAEAAQEAHEVPVDMNTPQTVPAA